MAFDVGKHSLVPKHAKLSESDKASLLENYAVNLRELPKISAKDPAAGKLNVKPGDVVKIVRPSRTSGTTEYYRVVIEG